MHVKFHKTGQAVSEEYGNLHCDTKILYIRDLRNPSRMRNLILNIVELNVYNITKLIMNVII